MALPINIEDLLNKRKVESNRIEFKASWNPDKIYHTICAFATDLENTGGGYILVGVEEENGIAKRPVKGLDLGEIDKIQKQMVGFDAKIQPTYLSKVSIEEIDEKLILVIWVPSGTNRPYSVAESVVASKSLPKFYVRSKSSTIEAKGEVLDQVRNLANRIPFDERGNESISFSDISQILVYDYLKTVGSKLIDDFSNRTLPEILDEMDLLTGPVENRLIKNCAAMMFCEKPEKFFPVARVDIVLFPEGSINNPDVMIEIPPIVGPVPKMIYDTLSYLRTNVIKKKIIKPSDSEKSITITNYPFQAFEEAVVNALYHRDYLEREPVEITIEPTHIDILSYSGPDCSISKEAIKEARRLKARRYRNRRLGDFLKELELTEGRATGIPTIQKALRRNGSDPATIETDDNRTYFLLTIPCRTGFEHTNATTAIDKIENIEETLLQIFGNNFVKVQNVINQHFTNDYTLLSQLLLQLAVNVWNKVKVQNVLELLAVSTIKTLVFLKNYNCANITELLNNLEIDKTHEFRRKILNPLIEMDYISMTIPDKPKSSKQKYILADKGLSLF